MGIYEEISSNVRKSYALIFLFFVILVLLGYALGAVYGNPMTGLAITRLFFLGTFSSFFGSQSTLHRLQVPSGV